jgi:hypothetical protein
MPPAGGFFMPALVLVSMPVFCCNAVMACTLWATVRFGCRGVLQRDRSNLAKFIADDNKLLRARQLIWRKKRLARQRSLKE